MKSARIRLCASTYRKSTKCRSLWIPTHWLIPVPARPIEPRSKVDRAYYSHCQYASTRLSASTHKTSETHRTMMVILQHTPVTYPTMVRPLASAGPRLSTSHAHSLARPKPLTSGRICPHRRHGVTPARVTCTISVSDQRTPPVSALRDAERRGDAHSAPCAAPGARGGSSANPGGTVHTQK